jgi:hypothetical protein
LKLVFEIPLFVFLLFFEQDLSLMNDEEALSAWNGGGLFWRMMMNRLESFSHNSTEVNLALTDILSSMATFPYPLLHLFVLDGFYPVRRGVVTVWSTLQKVSTHTKSVELSCFTLLLFHRLSS